MSGVYEIRLSDGWAYQIGILDQVELFTYVKSLELPGTFILVVPDIYPDNYWGPDRLVQFWRRGTDERAYRLDFVGLLRRWRYFVDNSGARRVMLVGQDQNKILERRIVAYPAGTAETIINNEPVDDGMKKVVRENLGSDATDGDRDLSAAGFSVQVDRGQGASITKEHAWRNVGQLLRDLNQLSREQTPEVLYWVKVLNIQAGQLALRFETGVNYLGHDFGRDSTRPLYFSEELGNVLSPALEYDYGAEANYIYAGGMGEGTERTIIEASDPIAERVSPWARAELFVDYRNASDDTLADEADRGLAEGRPITRFEADILDTPQAPYGLWNLGDRVTVIYRNLEIDALIRAVKVSVLPGGSESIAAQVSEIIT